MSSIANSNVKRLAPRTGMRPRKRTLVFEPEQIWLDKDAANHPQAIRILNKLPNTQVDIVEDMKTLKHPLDLGQAKQSMILTTHKGLAFKPCQGMGQDYICCNYRVMDLISGCPMECSYCILQSYLANNPITTIFVNIETILSEVSQFLAAHQGRFFRIGTGELSDSLALDHITEFAPILVSFFASKRNALLELKTKTTAIDHLLELKHKNRTVISWSVNTPSIIESEERLTTPLDERLIAAQKAAQAGFGVGFHFDPIILTKNLEEDVASYKDVIAKIFAAIEPKQITWISLGLLRYPPDLALIARKRFLETKIFTGEFVPSGNKMRYMRLVRQSVYKPLWDALAEKLPPHKIYLCMETDALWEKVDPTVKGNSCLEKRLCNTESIPFDFRF